MNDLKLPEEFHYAVCLNCNHMFEDTKEVVKCPNCGQDPSGDDMVDENQMAFSQISEGVERCVHCNSRYVTWATDGCNVCGREQTGTDKYHTKLDTPVWCIVKGTDGFFHIVDYANMKADDFKGEDYPDAQARVYQLLAEEGGYQIPDDSDRVVDLNLPAISPQSIGVDVYTPYSNKRFRRDGNIIRDALGEYQWFMARDTLVAAEAVKYLNRQVNYAVNLSGGSYVIANTYNERGFATVKVCIDWDEAVKTVKSVEAERVSQLYKFYSSK